jgi:hypothetical protein
MAAQYLSRLFETLNVYPLRGLIFRAAECVGCAISASRLYELSEALDVLVAFFFEGLAGTDAKAQKP